MPGQAVDSAVEAFSTIEAAGVFGAFSTIAAPGALCEYHTIPDRATACGSVLAELGLSTLEIGLSILDISR